VKDAIVMIGGGVQQVAAVTLAQSWGYRVIVTDRSETAPCFDVADECWVADGRDAEAIAARVLARKEELGIRGVFTMTELVTTAAAVAEAAGLPGPSISSAEACQDKARCKKLWLDAGVATPAGGAATTLEEAEAIADRVGPDLFVKPAAGFGGKGARRITAGDGKFARAFDAAKAASSTGEVIVEELLSGAMHDANGIFDDRGAMHDAAIADRIFAPDFPVEIEARCPTVLEAPRREELLRLVEEGARALGIHTLAVKADLVLCDRGFFLLEIAPRLHGPKGTLWLYPRALGFHPLRAALEVIAGRPFDPSLVARSEERPSLYRAISSPRRGRIKEILGLDAAGAVLGVDQVLLLAGIGSVVGPPEDSTQVPGYVFASGKSFDDASAAAERAISLLRFELE
jgi:S-sulfo-L-cysteine synthase (3-phospho-L-serine-dependent)